MPFYIRKISSTKWLKDLEGETIPTKDPNADAITGCTRTLGDSLSLWLIENDTEPELNNALLALASTMTKIENIDILILDKKAVDEKFEIKQSDMQNPFSKMNKAHYDITKLRYSSLKDVADTIITGINNKKSKKYIKGTVKELVLGAVNDGTILKKDLNANLKYDLWPAEFPKPA